MKRTNPDNMRGGPGGPGGPGQNKRFRQDPYNDALAEGKFELRVLVPSKAAGAVIGKGGEYIKSLREKYDATLTVPDRSTPERVLTMVVDQARVIQCFTDCLGKLAEFQEQKKAGELEVRILVHQSHAGAIIGRGGQKIKELREQTQSQIKVFQECCPNSTDRVVLITTDQTKVPFVVQTLIDFMREIPIKGIQKPYDPTNYDPRMVFNYGGFQTDKPFNAMPGGMGGRGPPPPPMPPNPYGDAYGRGPMGGGYGGPPYGGRPGGPPPPPMGAPPLGGPGFGGPGLEGPVTTTQVTIPNELGGTIIGKGGERINRIRAESGARIDVGNAFGNEERIITISGTPHQIQTAQYLLQQSVRASEAGRRYLREQR